MSINITSDMEVEQNEDFTVVLSDPTNNPDLTVDPAVHTVTITNDDGKTPFIHSYILHLCVAHRREWKLLRDEGQWGGQKKTLDARKCHTCGEAGHLARNCKKDTTNGKDKEDKSTTEKQGSGSGPQKKDKATVKCYNCGQLGHFANRCPSNALLCHDGQGFQ